MGIFDRILGRRSADVPWGYLYTTWGEAMICLPDAAPRLTDVAFVPGNPGERSYLFGHGPDGEPTAVALAPLHASIALASVRSVLVATGWGGPDPRIESAVVDLLANSPIIVPKPPGKVFKVTLDEVIDDGLESEVWQGSVSLHPLNTPGWILPLQPAFQIRRGSTFRFVGNLTGLPGYGQYFREWCWVDPEDRIGMFADEMMWNFACSKAGDDFDKVASEAIGAVVRGLQHKQSERRGQPVPFVLREFGIEFEQESVEIMRRTLSNGAAAPADPASARMVPSPLPATPCEVARRVNGKVIVAMRDRLGRKPEGATLTVLEQTALSADDRPCRMLLTLRHRDGTGEELLLSSAPEHMVERISGMKAVAVKEGPNFDLEYDAPVESPLRTAVPASSLG